jgi:methionyl-tRNA formyltransferase
VVDVGRPLRIVFFGTPGFARITLDALLASRHPVVGVVTQPDRPRGRGQRKSDAPVKARAVEAELPILQPVKLRDPAFSAALAGFAADLGVVAAYGRLLPDVTLAVPPMGMVNVHASLLPRYRGAAPVHRAVIAGDRETGVTIMRMVKELDAGPTLAAARLPIGPDETSAEVEGRLAVLGADLLLKSLDALSAGTATETPQDDSRATYAPPLRKDEGFIDWKESAAVLHDLVRGLHPWPHAFTHLAGKRVIILRSAVDPASGAEAPGTVVVADRDTLAIATGAGRLRLVELQPEGKRPMAVRDFLAGHRVHAGERVTSP